MGTDIKPPDEALPKPTASIPFSKLQVPLMVAMGLYEKLTDEELNDHYADIRAECARRGWDLRG